MNEETIRRAVHRTTVFGERQSHSPLHNDLLYHFYIQYVILKFRLQLYSITAAVEDEMDLVNRKSFHSLDVKTQYSINNKYCLPTVP